MLSKDESQYEIIEPVTGIVIGSSVILDFASEFAFGFLDALQTLARNMNFIPKCENIAYMLGASEAIELFKAYKRKCVGNCNIENHNLLKVKT